MGRDGHRGLAGGDRRFAGPPTDPQAEGHRRGAETRSAEASEPTEAADDVSDIEIVGMDHVQLSMPAGGEAEARAFYGAILGLREVVKPVALAGRGGCWFAGPGVAIHLGVEAGFAPLAKAHPALLVGDLFATRQALAAAGVAVTEDDSGLPIQRCYVSDPFGNRIELVDAGDAGFSVG
jgi:catechol 2,3-dioxygenase-like lactoylglutathione lyase family enzyme